MEIGIKQVRVGRIRDIEKQETANIKGSSLDIAPLTILDSGALQPLKWQLTGIGCSTAAQASGCP